MKPFFAVLFAALVLAFNIYAQSSANSIQDPSILMKTTPGLPSASQLKWERLQQRLIYIRDKQDSRRATVCI